MPYIMQERFLVACWRNGDINPHRYWGNITTSYTLAQKWLEEAKTKLPGENWKIYSFWD